MTVADPSTRWFEWNGEKVKVSAEDRYKWYKTKDKASQLVGHITSMSAWKLASAWHAER